MSIATQFDPETAGTTHDDAGTDGVALRSVLEWVRHVDERSPSLGAIPGVSGGELKQLARLSSLILGRIGRDSVPTDLIDRLTCEPRVLPTPEVVGAFARLVEQNAVLHLAELYVAAVQQPSRRALGTFFTPRDAAQSIVREYAAKHPAPSSVVDVGAGVGIFSEVAREQWHDASIRAVDINPVTLGLQAVVSAARPDWRVDLELTDYRAWLEDHQSVDSTLYLGNPPYTRWQLLDHDERSKLISASAGLVGARANLSTLFLAMTISHMGPQDSIAMIIPAGWMHANYGRNLRSKLRGMTNRQVALRLADSWSFENAIVETVVVEVGPEERAPRPMRVSDWSGFVTLNVARDDGAMPLPMPHAGRLLRPSAAEPGGGSNLGEFLLVKRGTATGAHEFFVKKAAEWDGLGIERKYLRPLARRLRSGPTVDSPELEQAALLVLDGYERGTDPHVDVWLERGESLGVDQRHLCGKRRRWFDLAGEVSVPDVLLAAFGRDVFRLRENDERLVITNNIFGISWKQETPKPVRQGVLSWLRGIDGQAALLESASVEANGLRRLSPKAIASIAVPADIHGCVPFDVDRASAAEARSRST